MEDEAELTGATARVFAGNFVLTVTNPATMLGFIATVALARFIARGDVME